MIAVVTGGSGFIGQHLIRRLRREGHTVRCLIRPEGRPVPADVQRFVVRYEEPGSLLACEALDGADVVFHLAGATRALRSADFRAANVAPTRHLLAAIVARGGLSRFVYMSSQAAAGPAPARHRAVVEEDVPRPIEAYGRSKLEAERIVEHFGEKVATTIVRPCAVFGPGDRDFLALFRCAHRGLLVYPGVADHWLSILYVDDLLDGLLAAARSPEAVARTYFLASESPLQWRALGELMAGAAERAARHVDLPRSLVRTVAIAGDWLGRLTGTTPLANRSKAVLAEPKYWLCSASRARRELGFAPSRSLPDAVRETYYWYRHSGWLGGSPRAAVHSPDSTG
jgi:nucleoside-diphosphate-sugar epimerase